MALLILAVLTEPGTVASTLDAAVAAAAIDSGTRIEALHVRVDPEKIARTDEDLAMMRLAAHGQPSAAQQSERVRQAFDIWLAMKGGDRVAWREVIAEQYPAIAEESIAADMVVVLRGVTHDTRGVLGAALADTECPALIIPENWSSVGADAALTVHMVVAWKPCDECRRAIHGAMPWLARARHVTILTLGEDVHTDEIVTLLADLPGRTQTLNVSVDGDDGETLVREASRLGATSLVIGGRQGSAILSWFTGSTSRQIIDACLSPVFTSR